MEKERSHGLMMECQMRDPGFESVCVRLLAAFQIKMQAKSKGKAAFAYSSAAQS